MSLLLTEKHSLAVAIDFDGTITELDVVDAIVLQYSKDKAWIRLEKEWSEGKISSAECLWSQLEGVRITEKQLRGYLDSVKVEPGFRMLKEYLDSKGIPLIILSDGFDLLIKSILKHHHLDTLALRCNHLNWEDNRLIPEFPHKNKSCGRCAHCKKSSLLELKPWAEKIIFIGDGLSDRCAIEVSDAVFAKKSLATYCHDQSRDFTGYNTLEDVTLMIPAVIDSLRSDLKESVR